MRIQDHAGVLLSVRERCRTLGVSTLRCDLAGTVVDDAAGTPSAGTALESDLPAVLANATTQWASEQSPRLIETASNAFLIGIPEGSGKNRQGYLVAILPSRATSADGTPTGYDRPAAELLRTALRWMVEDIARGLDQQDAVGDLTTQLTDSYETLDALYSIGKSMQGLDDPASFIASCAQRLHASLRFDTIFVKLGHDPEWTPGLKGRVITAGRSPATLEVLTAAALSSIANPASGPGFQILTGDERMTDDDHREALVIPLMRKQAQIGILVGMHKTGPDRAVSSYDIQLMESSAGFLGAFLDNVAVYEEQRQLFLGTVQALTAAIDAKDRYTRGHSDRVAHLSAKLAEASGMTPEQVHRVWLAGLVHDVGKIGVPEAVLCKQGRLNDEEFGAIKKHPEIGHTILKAIRPLADVLPGVLYHHEKYDGRGYPSQLVGQQIPMLARIISLADTFDAMSSTRSYRPAMPREKVLEEIRRCAGTQFDPGLAMLFVQLDFSEFDAMVERSRAAEAWAAAAASQASPPAAATTPPAAAPPAAAA